MNDGFLDQAFLDGFTPTSLPNATFDFTQPTLHTENIVLHGGTGSDRLLVESLAGSDVNAVTFDAGAGNDFLDARDAGQGFLRALEWQGDGHLRVLLSAADTFMEEETEALVRRVYPGVALSQPIASLVVAGSLVTAYFLNVSRNIESEAT